MGTYEELKAAIQQVITTNGNNEITGALLQQTLLSIVNTVGSNATFAGIATPTTNPGTPDQNIFYFAIEAGNYVNFGGIIVNKGEPIILTNQTGQWVKTILKFATQQQIIQLSSYLSNKTFNLFDKETLETNYIAGAILYPNGEIRQTTATAYGIVYCPVSKGKTYHLYCSETQRYTDYANVVFSRETPLNGFSDYIISVVEENGETEVDVFYTAIEDGYISLMIWQSTNYYIEQTTSEKNLITREKLIESLEMWRSEIPIEINKIGWAREGEIIHEGTLSDGYRMSDYIDVSFATILIASVEGNGIVDTISFFNKDKQYIDSLAIREGGLNNYIIDFTSEAYKEVVYITIGIATLNPDNSYARLIGKLGEVLKQEPKIKNLPIEINKIGWARIGERVYPGTLSDNYRMSDYVDIQGYGGLDAVVEGNSTIDTISFFDKDLNYLPNLTIKGSRRYRLLFDNDKYKDVVYISIGSSAIDSSYIYATLIPPFIRNKSFANKILCIGDSLTNSKPPQETGDYPHKWVEGVCAELNIPEFSMGGGAGLNIANVGSDSIYSNVMALSKDDEVDIVTLWGGTNDWGGGITIGNFDEQVNTTTRDTTTFIGGLCACVEKLLSLYPTKKIILIGTTPRTWDNGQKTYHNTPNAEGVYLKEYVDAVKSVAEWYGLSFLDLLRKSGMNILNMENYFYPQSATDGSLYYLHFNQTGENLLAERISAFIKTIL